MRDFSWHVLIDSVVIAGDITLPIVFLMKVGGSHPHYIFHSIGVDQSVSYVTMRYLAFLTR